MRGCLCPNCHKAVDRVGAMGPTALEFAYLAHLEEVGRGEQAARIKAENLALHGLVGWAALGKGTEPNLEPWEHVSLDL